MECLLIFITRIHFFFKILSSTRWKNRQNELEICVNWTSESRITIRWMLWAEKNIFYVRFGGEMPKFLSPAHTTCKFLGNFLCVFVPCSVQIWERILLRFSHSSQCLPPSSRNDDRKCLQFNFKFQVISRNRERKLKKRISPLISHSFSCASLRWANSNPDRRPKL